MACGKSIQCFDRISSASMSWWKKASSKITQSNIGTSTEISSTATVEQCHTRVTTNLRRSSRWRTRGRSTTCTILASINFTSRAGSIESDMCKRKVRSWIGSADRAMLYRRTSSSRVTYLSTSLMVKLNPFRDARNPRKSCDRTSTCVMT